MRGDCVARGPALWRVSPGFLAVASSDGSSVEMGGSAAAIWQMLPADGEEPIELDALVAQLAIDHAVPVATVAADANRVLDVLQAIGCVRRFA